MSHHNPGNPSATPFAHLIEHLAHVLPAQAPIRDFVHHNTLHGYQHLPFTEALSAHQQLTGAQGYLPAERFRSFYAAGRITEADLDAALTQEGIAHLDAPILPDIDRRAVLKAVLLHPLPRLSRSQLRWQLEEVLAPESLQDGLWSACLEMLDLDHALRHPEDLLEPAPGTLTEESDIALTSHRLRREAHALQDQLLDRVGKSWSLRGLLLALTGEDILDDLRPALIRPLAAYLDKGLASWQPPSASQGFYAAWCAAARRDAGWLLGDLAEDWWQLAERLPDNATDAITQELRLMGLPEDRWDAYLERLALEIPGWAGMALQMSQVADAAPMDMRDFLAVRLILERVLSARLCRRHWHIEASLSGLRWQFNHNPAELLVRHALFEGKLPEFLVDFAERLTHNSHENLTAQRDANWDSIAHLLWRWLDTPTADRKGDFTVGGTAWPLFQLCRHLGISGNALRAAEHDGVRRLLACMEELDSERQGYLWLLAYEHHYREQIFAAVAANHGRGPWALRESTALAQLVWCMDDREEGIRRHLEEINPQVETLGAAAHYNVFLNWTGLGDRVATGLCPVVAKPQHAIHELPHTGQDGVAHDWVLRRQNNEDRRYRLLQRSRNGLASVAALSMAGGPLAALALLGKTLLPARLGLWNARRKQRGFPLTEVACNAKLDAAPASVEHNRLGMDDIEQADRCEALLRNIGLTYGFAPLVAIMGHGSNSENNPHMAAYDCGACSGRHSGPNARLWATMANRPVIRNILAARGIEIPASTWFLGAEHNTCDDGIAWYDIDALPVTQRQAFEQLSADVAAAALAHMQERCRRFASAPNNPSLKRAWRHIQDRRWDWSQPRPELGHATNAWALIGRRSVTRGIFLDRRAFLISYDPTRDADGTVLERLLLANGPVGAGISLEYYFSTVDNERYGCGTKTVHNVAGFFGVMEGASSDLRTGLPRQMIEIHEAMRLLVVVEHHLDVITAIYQRQPPLQELIGNGWLVVAAKDPDSSAIHLFDPRHGWLPWQGQTDLPTVAASYDWFANHREPLPPVLLKKGALA